MLSVVITACQDHSNLYLTYFSLLAQLEAWHVPYEVTIVADGGSETKWEKLPNTRCLRGQFGSPQASRDAGIKASKFDNVLVLESHVVLSDSARLVVQHEMHGSALTFPYRRAEGTELFDVYGHEVDWQGNLWHKKAVYQPFDDKPYRVAQFGQSCFVLDRRWYLESGGYTDLMRGWGGEEPFLCLKAWLLGRECWLVPDVWHAHYLMPGAHGGVQHTPDFVRNFQVLACVIRGDLNGRQFDNGVWIERNLMLRGPFEGNLAKLREFMNANKVLN